MPAAEMLCIMLYRVENLLVVRTTVNWIVNFRQFSVKKSVMNVFVTRMQLLLWLAHMGKIAHFSTTLISIMQIGRWLLNIA